MAYWLIKSEPSSWSWADQVTHGSTNWDGVRNYQAANNLKAMRLNDECLFYHSVNGKEIMGIVTVSKEACLDPSDETGRFVMVEVKTGQSFPKSVTLEQIKAHPLLQDLALIKQSRLSVMPITPEAWQVICHLGGLSQ